MSGYRCQFCSSVSPITDWIDDECQACCKNYDPTIDIDHDTEID